MAKIICLFNHKGGVSKTTTTFNLGWMMARKGKKVLLVDLDPQCNLTGMILGYEGIDDLEPVYTQNPPNNVKDGLAPAFESQPKQIEAARCMEVLGNKNLFLLPGHIALSEYETTLGVAQELSGSLLPLRNLPGAMRYLIDLTAKGVGADYVLVDMSPSLGPLNQNIVCVSDYFIVPLHPDYFSSMALNSLARVLPRWKKWADAAVNIDVLKEADYPFQASHVQFVGAIIQKYRPRNGHASTAFQKWIDKLLLGLKENLIPALKKAGMLNSKRFERIAGFPPSKTIMEVADFNSLIAFSQDNRVPVYELTQAHAAQTGAVWDQTRKNMKAFEKAFSDCADVVLALTA